MQNKTLAKHVPCKLEPCPAPASDRGVSEAFFLTRAHSRSAACPAYLTPIAALRRSGNLCALSSTFAPSSRAAHATTYMYAMHAVTGEITARFQQLATDASRQWLSRAPGQRVQSGTYEAVILPVGHADVVAMAHCRGCRHPKVASAAPIKMRHCHNGSICPRQRSRPQETHILSLLPVSMMTCV